MYQIGNAVVNAGNFIDCEGASSVPKLEVKTGMRIRTPDGYSTVTKIHSVRADIVRIVIERDNFVCYSVTATANCKFKLADKNEWVKAADLHHGHRLETDDGKPVFVRSAELVRRNAWTQLLRVDGDGSFFLGGLAFKPSTEAN